jgi:hypothetical protein
MGQLRQFIDTTGPVVPRQARGQGVLGLHRLQQYPRRTGIHHPGPGEHVPHWDGIIVPPGYTDPIQFQSGNPYGTSYAADGGAPGEVPLEAARYQARRVVEIAAALKAGRAADPAPNTGEPVVGPHSPAGCIVGLLRPPGPLPEAGWRSESSNGERDDDQRI